MHQRIHRFHLGRGRIRLGKCSFLFQGDGVASQRSRAIAARWRRISFSQHPSAQEKRQTRNDKSTRMLRRAPIVAGRVSLVPREHQSFRQTVSKTSWKLAKNCNAKVSRSSISHLMRCCKPSPTRLSRSCNGFKPIFFNQKRWQMLALFFFPRDVRDQSLSFMPIHA